MNTKFPLILAFLCVVGGRASAQVNLLPQGNFENPGANTGWAEGFNIPNNQEFQVVSENGKHWLRIENRDAGRQLDYVHAYVKVTPQIASLTVSARMRATNLKIGKEGWHTARVAMSFEGGSFGFPAEVPELRADSDWVTKSVELKVPKGATRLNIQPAMFHCTGVFEIADLTVTPHLVGADAVGRRRAAGRHHPGLGQDERQDGECQAGAGLPGRHLALHPRSRRRRRNRRSWAGPISRCRATGRFTRAGLPISWPSAAARSGISMMGRGWRAPGTSARCQSRRNGKAARSACASTACARTRLSMSTARSAGRVAWPWGSVDITSAVTPGQTADIRVLVAAIADAEKVGTFWQNAFSERLLHVGPAQDAGPDRQRLLGKPFLRGAGDRCLRAHFNPEKGRLPGRGA